MKGAFSRVFTLKVDGWPILAFEADGQREARQICKERWLHDDLAELKSDGVPLYTAQSKLSVRPATAEEAIVFGRAAKLAKPSDDMVLAYLVTLDDGAEPS
jgi:hypothetical protein